MRKSTISLTFGLALALGPISTAAAAETAPTASGPPSPAAEAGADFNLLKGAWVRPDGGYNIVIRNVSASGQIEAMYFNPSQLPFAKAEALRKDGKLHASFELRAGGYNGSTYDLAYDPASDRLGGVYYQAVARQKYDVVFVRRR